MRTLTAVLLATAALAATATPAPAAVTSSYMGGTLTVASDEAGDTMTLACDGAGNVILNGSFDTLANCTGAGAAGTVVVLGNGGADAIDASGLTGASAGTVTLDGGGGADGLTGVYLASNGQTVSLLGGPENDVLASNSSDVARGGPGDDRIVGPVQDGGTLDGEDGADTFALALPGVTPTSFAFTLTATGMTIAAPPAPATQQLSFTSIEVVDLVLDDGAQTVDGTAFPGTLRVDARGGADTITGTSGADTLNGGPGNDFMDGRGGADAYLGGPGLDLLHARDGVADSADCGEEEDTIVADPADVLAGCERVELPVVAVPPDVVKPALGLQAAKLRKRRLSLPVSCPATEVRCAGIVTLSGIGRRRGATVRVALGAITFRVAGGKARTLARRVPRSAVRKLRGLRRLRLRVSLDVVDAAGNRATGVERVKLRR